MVEMKIPGVKLYRSRGKVYAYHRRTGTRIRAPFGTAEFLIEVQRLNGRKPPPAKHGTLGALIAAYRRSPEFHELAERTRRDYIKVLDYLKPLHSDQLASITSAYVIDVRDAAFGKHKRRFANYVLQVLRLLFKWGEPRNHLATNPAAAVPTLRRPRNAPRANRAWADDEFEAMLAAATGGVKVAIGLGAFAGMREGDAISVPRTIDDGKWLRWTQSKTGTVVELPVHPRLRAILDAATADQSNVLPIKPPTLVIGVRGRPYTEEGFQRMFFGLVRQLIANGKVRPGLTFHGLRHTAGRNLADRGVDPRTIAALLGHKTLQMAVHYSEEADRKRRGAAAVAKLSPRTKPRTKVSNIGDESV
jgi:integrase